MDRPRTPIGWAGRVLGLAFCLGVIYILARLAIMLIGGFISPDSGEGFGNAGQLLLALLTIVVAGPFIALAVTMFLPMVSDNPRFRGANR